MSTDVTIKRCVGPLIYTREGKIFLMTSEKWQHGQLWIVPGGAVKKTPNGHVIETEEEALCREIREELQIELERIEFIKEKIKAAGSDFKNPNIEFHFIDFIALAQSTDVVPNKEIKQWGWFTIEEAKKLNLMDSTREFVESCEQIIAERVIELREYSVDKR